MTDQWIRFEGGRQKTEGDFGTITKDGRLLIPNETARESGVVPGAYVEVFYQPTLRAIALKVMPSRTAYSNKVTSTGPTDHPFDQPIVKRDGSHGGRLMAVVPLRSLLNTRHVGIASKVRGVIYLDAVAGMLIFEFPEPPKQVNPSDHVSQQMANQSFIPRVIGDVGAETATTLGETQI